MTDEDDADNSVGLLINCGYRWNDGKAYMAPGHNSVLHDADGSWYMVFHIREHNFTKNPEPSMLQIRKMYWTKSGWPYLSPQPYAGERDQHVSQSDVPGFYERISLVPALPQGISSSVPMKLGEDGYYECCSIQGSWRIEGERIHISYGGHEEYATMGVVWDAERDVPTLGISGMSDRGVSFWAKKVDD